MCKHHLRYTCGAIGRNVANVNSLLTSGTDVNVVESCGQFADVLQSWQRLDDLGGHLYFVCKHDISFFGALYNLISWCAIIHGQRS